MSAFAGFELQLVKSRIHPAAVLTLLDGHGRMQGQFAIGGLLGTVETSGRASPTSQVATVDIVDCMVVPYFAKDKTLSVINCESILHLKQKVFPKTQLLGWAISSTDPNHLVMLTKWLENPSPAAQCFVPSKALQKPLIFMFDATLKSGSLLGGTAMLMRTPFSNLYRRVSFTIDSDPAELSCIAAIARASTARTIAQEETKENETTLSDGGQSVRVSLGNLKALLEPCKLYLDKVVNGQIEGDAQVGRELSRALCVDSLLQPSQVEAACEKAVQDGMFAAALTNTAKQQVCAAEHLSSIFL